MYSLESSHVSNISMSKNILNAWSDLISDNVIVLIPISKS